MREILTIGKICWELRESIEGRADWDLIVVDAAATGHVIAQLGAADTMREMVAVGPIRGQTEWMSELLADPALTALNVVTTPEEMPVAETIELVTRVRSELRVPLGSVFVNRVLPELFTHQDEERFEAIAAPDRRDDLVAAAGPGVTSVVEIAATRGRDAAKSRRPARAPPNQRRPSDVVSPAPVHPVAGSAGNRDSGRCRRRGAGTVSETASLGALLSACEIVVLCGSGGVGKTSIAAAAGLAAASRLEAKVLVVTVDPAKRLADALGVEGIGNVERRVPDEAFARAGLRPNGELWAAMLDTKQSWDALVMRHAPDEETAYRILDNRLYENLTARFVQSHDYVAMERLYEIHQTGVYDLIVVDTPPTTNALDFLDVPARMAEFFGGRLLRWLTAPYRVGGKRGARMLTMASRPFYQMADRLLGSQFLQDIAEFFLNFQSMYDGFVERSRAVEALLHDRRTTFAVVTTLEDAPLREGERFCEELLRREFHLGALVLNKTLPPERFDVAAAQAATRCRREGERIASDLGLEPVDDVVRVLATVGAAHENFAVVARREADLRAELVMRPDVIVDVPALAEEISDLAGLARIASCLVPD